MLYLLKRQLSKHVLALSKVIDIDDVMMSNSLTSFEERLHCHLHGYRSMAEYWECNNPVREVDEITIPVLCINSLDDPICKEQCIPYSLFTDCPNFMLVTSPIGGHCGFLDGNNLEPWADKVALEYIASVLEFTSKNKHASQFS
jgi:abhydrolase domain-containing protein 15